MGEVAQLRERRLHLLAGRGEQRPRAGVAVGLRGGTGQAQLVGERQEPLLRTVVEVALDAPAGRVARLDDPGTRGAQVLELGEHLGSEPLVVDRQPRGRADLALELAAPPRAPGRG